MRRALLPLAALTLAVPVLTLGFSNAVAKPGKGINAELAAAVAHPSRAEDRARDKYRQPGKTLAFMQVSPEMKVGEYAPGGGWYSRLLGLYLGPKGKLVGLYFDPTSGAFSETAQKGIRDAAAKYPADVAKWSGQPAERFAGYALDAIPAGEKGSFDRILIMRMVHNLMRWNIADREIKAMRDLLEARRDDRDRTAPRQAGCALQLQRRIQGLSAREGRYRADGDEWLHFRRQERGKCQQA